MDYPTYIDTISMEMSILYFKGLLVKFLLNDVSLSLKIVFILANSANLDKIPPYHVAFHLGLHCLPNMLFTQNKSRYMNLHSLYFH